jgi:HPt (histidine-containing phosphotransfer) domain-containing protein
MLNPHPRPLASPESSGGSSAGHAAPGSGAGAPATLDADALARLAALDPKGENRLLERVLNAFQSSATRLMPQLEAARRSADRGAIRLVAHTLKSSSASIGALALSRLCAQVEAAIRLDTDGDLDADLDAMAAAVNATLQAIERLLMERR